MSSPSEPTVSLTYEEVVNNLLGHFGKYGRDGFNWWGADMDDTEVEKYKQEALKALHDIQEREIEQAEDAILDDKMQAIDKIISDFIGKRIRHPMADKPEIEEDPINYEPLVREVRDFARNNAYGNRILDRALALTNKTIEMVEESRKGSSGSQVDKP